MNNLIVFLILSLPLVLVSRRSLSNIRSHGFYRFLAWEGMLWLLIINLRFWFTDPLAPHQLTAWFCLFYALVLVIAGTHLLRRSGRARSERDDATLYQFEKTTALVETGIYRYIRHPLYGSLLFLNWGIFFKHPAAVPLGVAILVSILLTATARIEEQENIAYFGPAYRDYMRRSKMFVPYLF
ncbi:MAG: isoprenylcysteine carboxylmethyltransferase family protein [Candidatus Neomarinimicrobiota bacterium]